MRLDTLATSSRDAIDTTDTMDTIDNKDITDMLADCLAQCVTVTSCLNESPSK